MSYVNMDHAAWVQRNVAASKGQKMLAADKRRLAEHRGWFAAPDELTPFQRRAFDILGIVGNGIYNAPISWDTVYWHPRMLSVSWRKTMATFDFTALTQFVFLCHDARIRGDIGPRGRYLEIHLSERAAEGAINQRHPNLEEAVEAWRTLLPGDHPIMFRAPAQVEAGAAA